MLWLAITVLSAVAPCLKKLKTRLATEFETANIAVKRGI